MCKKNLFTIKGAFAVPSDSRYSFYNIPIIELTEFEGDRSRWFSHLCEKKWFTEDYLFDLLEIAKEYHPNFDFTRHVFLAAFTLAEKELLTNPDNRHLLTLAKMYEK